MNKAGQSRLLGRAGAVLSTDGAHCVVLLRSIPEFVRDLVVRATRAEHFGSLTRLAVV
eukprot:COSAG02_NODE_328_length_24547_cov_4.124141_5_plen_58_part_00